MKNLLLIICLVLGLTACDKENSDPNPTDPVSSAEARAQLSDGQLQLGFDLLQAAGEEAEPDENVLISPLSIGSALYMAYNGADGNTRAEMEQVLGLDELAMADVNDAYLSIMMDLEQEGEQTEVGLANALFYDPAGITPKDDFLKALEDHFDTSQQTLDFTDPATVDLINDWVKEQTKNRIDKIIESISPEEKMFINNALYFKSDWMNPFAPEATRDRPFTDGAGNTQEVPFMSHDTPLDFFEEGDISGVRLPFSDTNFVMHFLLPASGQTVSQLLTDLDNTRWNELSELYQTSRLQLYLPKFKVEDKLELKPMLTDLGMKEAFQQTADFSQLGTAAGNIYLTRVVHKTFLEIDEKGAEGAAVTSIGVGVTSVPPTMTFDRPFVIAIEDRRSGVLLFLGTVRAI